ncbi:Nuclear cap-binding protein subunit 1 [Hypsibius exemplaris]|uniref:Nuclear cap-binding protein subunit 1 n=1 Tax=Hypsibius exemplaris TaxID=2072580 RepID=A0A1W0WKL7_HYPEX|nr:Nuclear cap-binding protein subunit 1 [Hypsibius exemplaris]
MQSDRMENSGRARESRFDPGPQQRGGGGRGHYNQYGGRRSYGNEEEGDHDGAPSDIEKRLESLITRLGERSNASLDNNIKNLARVLNGDIANFKETILAILLKCSTTMPEKISIYTTLAGLLNVENYAFGGEFVDGLARKFRDLLNTGSYSQAELVLRVIADCANSNMISFSSLIMFMEILLEVTYDKNIPQTRSDWYAYAVLSCMPWIGERMNATKPEELRKLLEEILSYITRRKKIHVAALRIIKSDDPLPQEDYLDSLWTQVEDLKNRQWREKHILRPYTALEHVISKGQTHNLPQIIPPSHEEGNQYPLPRVIFRLFDFTDCPEGSALPPMNSIERFLIEDDLYRLIEQRHEDRRNCAVLLLNYPTSQTNIPLDYIVTEVMLGQLMQLPKSPLKEIMYGATILELCKVRQDVMLQTLALAVSLLYERVEHLNVSCLHRLASWFAYHLSNYEFRWTWEDWSDSLQVDKEHPKAKFVTEILQGCIRLSYYSRIAEVIPQRFKVFLPEEPFLERKFDIENPETLEGVKQALEVHEAVRDKKDVTRILEIIREVPKPEAELDTEFNPLQIELFVHVVMGMYAKTFTHLFAALHKFSPVIRDLLAGEQEQIFFLQTLYDLFRHREYTMIVLVDRLLRMQLIDAASVVNWIFSKDMKLHFSQHHVWEILQQTIHRVSTLVQRCHADLEAAKAKVKEAMDQEPPAGADENPEPMEEDATEALEEAHDRSLSQQKNMFLVIFQRFVMAFTDHLEQPGQKTKATESMWWKTAIGHMQYILMTNYELIRPYNSTLEKLVFTKEIDKVILHAYSEYAALMN